MRVPHVSLNPKPHTLNTSPVLNSIWSNQGDLVEVNRHVELINTVCCSSGQTISAACRGTDNLSVLKISENKVTALPLALTLETPSFTGTSTHLSPYTNCSRARAVRQ